MTMNTIATTPLLRAISMAGLLAGLLLAGGRQTAQKRSYEISVRNESNTPVTVWLTKTGGVYETNWKSPEDLAIESRNANEQIAGFVVRPGERAGIGPVKGEFTPNSQA